MLSKCLVIVGWMNEEEMSLGPTKPSISAVRGETLTQF